MPSLDPAALFKQIAARRLDPIYLLTGEDTKLVDRLVDGIESTIDPGDRAFAVDRFHAGETDGPTPADMIASARTLPMLGDRRLVIILRAERLLKPKRASKTADAGDGADPDAAGDDAAADTSAIEDYLADPVPFSTLVFVASEIDRTRRLTKRLAEKARVVECGGLSGGGPGGARDARSAALSWVRDELQRAGRPIDPRAAHLLVDRCGDDITRLRGDVERLLLYTEGRAKITFDDVDEVASTQGPAIDDWGVTNAIADGDAGRALREIALRFDRGDSPHQLVGQLRWWVSTKLAEADPDRVKASLDALLDTDLALKSSGGDERVLMERLVVALTARALPRRRW